VTNEKGARRQRAPSQQTDSIPPQHPSESLQPAAQLGVVLDCSPGAPGVCYALPPSVVRSLVATDDDFTTCFGWSDAGRPRRKAIVRALCFAHALGWDLSAPVELAMCALGRDAIRGDALRLVEHARWKVEGGPYPGWNATKAKPTPPTGKPSKPTLSRDDRIEYLEMVRHLVSTSEWPGRCGNRDRSAMQAICDLSLDLKYPTMTPAVSGMALAAKMNCGEKVAYSALRSLQASGYLLKVGDGVGPCANTYLIRCPRSLVMGAVLSVLPLGTETTTPLTRLLKVSHPAFHGKALGRSVYRLLEHLQSNAPTENTEWFRAAQVSKAQFYKLLPKLNGDTYGRALAVHQDGMWRLLDDVLEVLDDIAEQDGTSAAVEHRAARSQLRRTGYLGHLMRQTPEANRYEMRYDGKAIDKLSGEILTGREAVTRSTQAERSRDNPAAPPAEFAA
jgi:hypothetical protein